MTGTRISFLSFVVNMHALLGWKCIRHLRSHIDPVIIMSDIYAKISVYEIKIDTLNAPLIFGKNGAISCKICHFYKCVYYISAKIILVPSALIFVGEWLQRQWHFWAWPLYILFKRDCRHRMHCLVFTDTDLYSLTKGKAYLANQRWRRSTCLRDQCYDVGCHPCYSVLFWICVGKQCIFTELSVKLLLKAMENTPKPLTR